MQTRNTLNGYLLPGVEETMAQETDALNHESTASPILGFYFDPETVNIELASCRTVIDNYSESLAYGTYENVEETLAQMNQDLSDAGMDKFLAEKQSQLDTWLATN